MKKKLNNPKMCNLYKMAIDKINFRWYYRAIKKRKEMTQMTIERYITTLEWVYDKGHAGSHYLINGSAAYKNRGELCESICKHHRGIYTEVNPNTDWETGSDIESKFASVKSSEGGLGRGIGGYNNSAEEKISYYLSNTHSTSFIWVELNETTKEVTEYCMNKTEFALFIQNFTRVHNMSNHKELCIRFKKSSKKMIRFLENLAIA